MKINKQLQNLSIILVKKDSYKMKIGTYGMKIETCEMKKILIL